MKALNSLRARLKVLFCRHRPSVHLCEPPYGHPYLIVCQTCSLVLYGEVTDEQAEFPDDLDANGRPKFAIAR